MQNAMPDAQIYGYLISQSKVAEWDFGINFLHRCLIYESAPMHSEFEWDVKSATGVSLGVTCVAGRAPLTAHSAPCPRPYLNDAATLQQLVRRRCRPPYARCCFGFSVTPPRVAISQILHMRAHRASHHIQVSRWIGSGAPVSKTSLLSDNQVDSGKYELFHCL